MNSLVSMVTPDVPDTISCPSFLQVIRIGMSPEDTTQAMYISLPMEVGGKSKGWMRGGTDGGKEQEIFSIKIQMLHGLQCNSDPVTLQKCTRTYTLTHIPPLQPIIAALIRAQLAWGIMALPWKQRWGAPSETSGGFNLGLVKIQLIKSETWQDKQHTILTSHWSQCSVVPVHTYTNALMQMHTLDLAVFVPGAVTPCMDTHGEVKIQNPTSEWPPFHLHLTYWK